MLSQYPQAELHEELTTSNAGYYPPICTYDWHFEMQSYEKQIDSAKTLKQYIHEDCDYIGTDAAGGPFYFNIVVENYGTDNIRIYVLYG